MVWKNILWISAATMKHEYVSIMLYWTKVIDTKNFLYYSQVRCQHDGTNKFIIYVSPFIPTDWYQLSLHLQGVFVKRWNTHFNGHHCLFLKIYLLSRTPRLTSWHSFIWFCHTYVFTTQYFTKYMLFRVCHIHILMIM